MTVIWFSATGNSLSVAKCFGGRLISMCKTAGMEKEGKICISDNEAVGMVMPVYFGNVPSMMRNLIGRMEIDAPYRFAVLTYGELAGRAALLFDRLVSDCGLHFDYIRTIKMVDNNFSVVNVSKQIKSQKRKHIDRHLMEIKSDVEARRAYKERPGITGSIVGFFEEMMPAEKTKKKFRVDTDKCNGCGLCSRICPSGNIIITDGKPAWQADCMKCTACYHNCPSGAIRYRGERSTEQFRNAAVSMQELLSGNSRLPSGNNIGK